jgi:hypothetical protein
VTRSTGNSIVSAAIWVRIADVSHRKLDGQPPIALQACTRCRALQHVGADRQNDAEAKEPAPVAEACRLCYPLVPAEAGSTLAQRVCKMARGEGPVLLGVGLSIVAQAQLYRIESEGVGQLVHRAFES